MTENEYMKIAKAVRTSRMSTGREGDVQYRVTVRELCKMVERDGKRFGGLSFWIACGLEEGAY